MDSVGHVWLVGAGPGDPGLLTVAGRAALAEADVVLYDALASEDVLRCCRADAEVRSVGKRSGAHSASQEEINGLLVRSGREGKRVVRLKGGDPFVFGRGGEEAIALRDAGVPFTVVPGVTSAVAVPAAAGIPVTQRGMASNFLVITGTDSKVGPAANWEAAARADTVIILMGGARLAEAAAALIAAGKPAATPAAAVSRGTLPGQQCVVATLDSIAAAASGMPTPIITVVGVVASLAGQLGPERGGPLAGKRVVVTRARAQASQLRGMLEVLGADVTEAPVIAIRPLIGNLITDARAGTRWDWVLFTSANAVEVFFTALRGEGLDARVLGTTRVAAVGDATRQALERYGVVADFVPSKATGECLGHELPRVHGARIYLPVSSLSDTKLADALRARGGHVEQVAAYETLGAPLDAEGVRAVQTADAVTFTSASTARFLREALGGAPLPPAARLVSIGPRTSEAVVEAFGRVDREAAEPGLAALVEAVVAALQ